MVGVGIVGVFGGLVGVPVAGRGVPCRLSNLRNEVHKIKNKKDRSLTFKTEIT